MPRHGATVEILPKSPPLVYKGASLESKGAAREHRAAALLFENFSLDLLRRNEQNNLEKLVGARARPHKNISPYHRTSRFSTFFLVENDEKVKSVFFQIMNGVQFSSSMLCKTMILYQFY